jgi:DNA-binding NarL/FixJ family response regulator
MDGTDGIAEALLTGRMQLVSREEDGAGGSLLSFEAAELRLSRRELAVLAAAESGVANKLVALEQSLACSTVSESLQTAIGKLGFVGRTEFLKVMACLRSGVSRQGVRLVGGIELCWVLLPVQALGQELRLTTAERQVVTGVLNGRTNAAIARARRTSSRTVANQLAAVYRKLGVSSRWELTAQLGRASMADPLA